MKKVFIVLLITVMIFSMSVIAKGENNAEGTFEPRFTNAFLTQNAKEIMGNVYFRSLLTWNLIMDASDSIAPYKTDISKPSYVGRNALMLCVALMSSETPQTYCILFYNTYDKTAAYSLLKGQENESEKDMIERVEYVMEQYCIDGYYRNDVVDLIETYNTMLEIINN